MRYLYDPYIFKRMADGRVFHVNTAMPFEFCLQCFQTEQPFFLIGQLEDGRLAITPNSLFTSWNLLEHGYGLLNLLPREFEYVTMKDGPYPIILTAHPVANVEDWLRKFEKWAKPFAKQSLSDFVCTSHEFLPIQFEKRIASERAVV